MLIVYKKTTGEPMNNLGKNELFLLGVPEVEDTIQNVVERFGGTDDDYGILRLHDQENAEVVNKTFTHEYTISNGEIEFGSERPVPEVEPTEPAPTELLSDYIVDVDYRVTMVELGL